MGQVHRSRGWAVAAGILGALTLLFAILTDQAKNPLFVAPSFVVFLAATLLFGLASVVLMALYWRTDKFRAAYPLALCLIFATLSLGWLRFSSSFYDAVIFSVRQGTFDQVRSDFQASRLVRFCDDEGPTADPLVRNMRKIGVTCVHDLQDGKIQYLTEGFLDHECGFLYTPDPSRKPLPAFHAEWTWTKPIRNGWYRYCTSGGSTD